MEMKINTIPTECTLYFTDVCNFNCAGCRRQTVDKPVHKEITLDLVKKILDEYPSLKSFCIAGYGEPTLGKHFTEVVNYLIDNDKYVGIITNGSYTERILQLKKAPNYISISLYGFTNEQYKNYVGAGLFSKVIDNFKKIKERFGNVGFSYFLNKDNYRSLEKVLELCDEVKPAFLNLANYLAYDSIETEDTKKIIKTSDMDIIKYIEEQCGSRKYINARPIYLDEGSLDFECSSYSNTINLDGEGNIGGCQRQIPPSLNYGNIYLEADPYNNLQMQTQRKRINDNQYPHPNCKTCFGRHNPNKIWQKVDSQLSSANIDVAIMLLFHEKVEQTIECIKSFLPSGKKIYVLNNNSSKDSTIRLKNFCKNYSQVQIFDSEKNLGVSVGRNYLLQQTTEDWAFFVDNDIYITNNDWLQKFSVHQKNENHVEVFIPRLFNLHENSFVTYYNWRVDNNKISYLIPNNGYLSNFPGGASIINRKIFKRLGLYDSEMFVGFEDFEFAIRGLLSSTPVTAKLIDDIELVHDHRKTENNVDKQAVLVRYNEDSHQKSFDRIQQKYPSLNFQHEWRSWVKEQKKKLINHGDYDLFTLTPEYNYGARAKSRTIINTNKNIYLKELNKNIKDKLNSYLSKNSFDKVILFQPQEDKSRYLDINFNCEVYFFTAKDLADFSRTNDINVLLERRGEKRVTEKDKVLLIIDHLLEKLEDPRIILRAVKKNLLLNKDNKAKILSQGRTKQGIDYPEDETSYREWKLSELKLHLASGGFEIVDSEENNLSTILITISLRTEKYNGYLKELNLPEINIHYLICSNEHGKAKLTGGIGSYIEEAQKLFKRNEFGVFLVSKGNMLPEKNIINNERILTFDKFFDNQVVNMNETAEMLLKSMQVVQYIYPYLNIVEIQDVEGFGYRVVQAKQSGLIAGEILIQIVSHGSKVYLENASQRWLPIINYDVIYKEKIALENADRLVFPTKFIKKLYIDAGYNFLQERTYQLRLPFEFKYFPQNQYKDVDTLIFYGKRYSMKGYDIFSEIVTLLDMEEIVGAKIKRVVMIGPFFPEMTKQNKYFELLRKRIEVVEVSTPREEAINIIKKLHSHSVCVLPYKSDNHPYSVLEIVETGCPFIFAKAGGIPELLPEKFHDKLLGRLCSDDLANKVKSVLFMGNNERYELYASLFAEMIFLQKDINQKFNAFNQRQISSKHYSVNRELTASLIVLFDADSGDSNNLLLNAINSQSMLPDKLLVVCKGSVDRDYIRKQVDEKIPIDFFDFDETYNRTKNNILKFIESDIAAVNGENDIPKNHFIESSLLYLNIHPEVQCVSGYADIVDSKKSIFDSSQIFSSLKPIGETGILEPSGKNVIALESAAFRSSFLKSISGWEEYFPGTDDLLTYIRIRSNKGKIGTIPKALVLRVKQKNKLNELNKFEFQMRRAVNSAMADKFDTYRFIGMILSNGFAQTSINPAEVGELDKYLITVQTLLLNGKLLEASEVINSIDAGIITQTESLARSQIITLKRKIDALTSKMNNREVGNNSTNRKDLVSVIIPTYNRPQSLLDAIQSVLNQTYDNFEIIVVNDAGEDVESKVRSFKDKRIKYIVHEKNKGLAGARNTGLNYAKGKYVSFLDDDDIFYENHLEVLFEKINNSELKVVYTDALRCIQKKENNVYVPINKELQYSLDYSQALLFIMNIAPVQCFLLDRSLIDKGIRFDESLTTHEDWEFWIKLSMETEFLHIKEVTSEYRHRVDKTNMVTTKLPDFLRTMKIIYNKYSSYTKDVLEIVENQNRRLLELEEQIRKESSERACSIIIVTYNSEKDISNCINSLENTLRNNDEVIIIDNNSNDNTVRILKEVTADKKRFKIIANRENIGFSGATNLGIKTAVTPNIILLNPDTVVVGDWIDSLISHLYENDKTGAVGPISNYVSGLQKMELYTKEKFTGNVKIETLYNKFRRANNGETVEAKILIGFCLAIKKNTIVELGLLDEKLFLGNDDLDLSWRLRLEGYKLIVAVDVFVYHKGQQSFKTVKKSKTDELVQQSTEHLYKKLEEYYGKGNIPTPLELWGINWFKPNNPDFNPNSKVIPELEIEVSIVIPVYNQLEYTEKCLNSIAQTVNRRVEVVFVNNASTDKTREFLAGFKNPKLKIKKIDNDTNLGFPASVNQGIKEAVGEYIIIANNDIVLTNGWLERMIESAESDSSVGIVGPISNEVSGLQKDVNAKYSTIEEMHKYASVIAEKNKGDVLIFPRVAFLCTLIKKEVIKKIGGLDERFTPGNYEDDDFCLRAQLAGYKTVIAKDVFIHHFGSKSFKAEGNAKYFERLKINEAKFVEKWGTTPDDLWLRNKPIKEHTIVYYLDKDIVKQSVIRANNHLNETEYSLALTELETAYNNYDENASSQIISPTDLLNMLGNISLIVGSIEKAKNYFEEELTINPESSAACLGLGSVFESNQDYEAAKTMFEWAVKNDRNNNSAKESLAKTNSILGLEVNHNTLFIEV